jgi:hypothetical protein
MTHLADEQAETEPDQPTAPDAPRQGDDPQSPEAQPPRYDRQAATGHGVRQVALPLSEPENGSVNARAFVRGALGRWGVADSTRHEVEQVASELVVHAFTHGSTAVDLQLTLDESAVAVHVRSRAATAGPSTAAADPDAVDEASPQLFIVGRLAVDWWVRHGPQGPVLWARVLRDDPEVDD